VEHRREGRHDPASLRDEPPRTERRCTGGEQTGGEKRGRLLHRWQCTEENYQSYIEDLKRRKGPDADQPHRVQYKKLVRV
jgi:hypothetical protein